MQYGRYLTVGASEVCFKTKLSKSLIKLSKQTNILTYHQFNNAQTYQRNDSVHYWDFVFSQSRKIQARVIYSYSAAIKTVQRVNGHVTMMQLPDNST